jgi:hypothetical protein
MVKFTPVKNSLTIIFTAQKKNGGLEAAVSVGSLDEA